MMDRLQLSAKEQLMLEAVETSAGLQTKDEALALYRLGAGLPDGCRILEIGSYLGASTIALGHGILGRNCEIYCLDCWHDYRQQGFYDSGIIPSHSSDIDILNRFVNNTGFLGKQLRVLKGTTSQFRDLLPDRFFDVVFIDGAHDYLSVIFDVTLAFRIVKPCGLLCGHDYHADGHDVVDAVNELIYQNNMIDTKGVFPGTSIWYAMMPESGLSLTPTKRVGD